MRDRRGGGGSPGGPRGVPGCRAQAGFHGPAPWVPGVWPNGPRRGLAKRGCVGYRRGLSTRDGTVAGDWRAGGRKIRPRLFIAPPRRGPPTARPGGRQPARRITGSEGTPEPHALQNAPSGTSKALLNESLRICDSRTEWSVVRSCSPPRGGSATYDFGYKIGKAHRPQGIRRIPARPPDRVGDKRLEVRSPASRRTPCGEAVISPRSRA